MVLPLLLANTLPEKRPFGKTSHEISANVRRQRPTVRHFRLCIRVCSQIV